MTEDQAHAVYDVLVAHAGANEAGREDFVFHHASDVGKCQTEYRFIGGLGFGGKFWRGGWENRWYVTAYPEDVEAFPERQAMIDATNAALAALRDEVMS